MAGLVALLTDFGTSDFYVGVMKGVMKSINESLSMIDITHEIRPQSIEQGAFVLGNSFSYFPSQTVFLVVVDPGVGSERNPIALQAGDYYFVGPDNGVFTQVINQIADWKAVKLENLAYQRPIHSNTFHGRDIFAPVAAHIASNPIVFKDLGQELKSIKTLEPAKFEVAENYVSGRIIHIDHFGNLITNIGPLIWESDHKIRFLNRSQNLMIDAQHCQTTVGEIKINRICRAYHQVNVGELLVQLDSNGYVEIASNQGNAQTQTHAKIGDTIKIYVL